MPDPAEEGPTKAKATNRLALDNTRLAYERTMLAWVRTSIALITFGFSIREFFRILKKQFPESQGLIGPHEIGIIMIIIGLLTLLLATLEHRSAMEALKAQYPMTEGYPEIPPSRARKLAALIAVLGLVVLISTLLHA
jgi:putative membrane protein